MSDLRSYSREFITEFIELYHSFPCLWKTKSKEYMNRIKKNEAYNILLAKLQDVEKSATKETVKTKLNTLRGGFRREYKKILSSQRSGVGADDVYVPTLWYYDLLLFVKDQEIPRKSITNLLSDSDNENNSEHSNEQQNEPEETACLEESEESATVLSPPNSVDTIGTASTSTPSVVKKGKKKRKTKPEEQADEVLTMVGERLRTNTCEDQFVIFGKNVAMKLRGLQRETRLYTEKLINEILFEAEMGNINRHTKIVGCFRQLHNDEEYQQSSVDSCLRTSTTIPLQQSQPVAPSYTVLQVAAKQKQDSSSFQHQPYPFQVYQNSFETQNNSNLLQQAQPNETPMTSLCPDETLQPYKAVYTTANLNSVSEDSEITTFIKNYTPI